MPIIRSVATSTGLRPNRSPVMPNRMPPSGRTTKPTPKVRNASSVPTTGSLFGKNSSPNTSAAAVPYRKKSYHSSADPILAARITRRRERPVLSAMMSVIVSPVLFLSFLFVCSRRLRLGAATVARSRRAGEVGFLRRGLRFVNRSLPRGRRQRKAHRHVGHPWRNDGIAGQQPAVELGKILHPHQRPGVARRDLVQQQVARPI